VPEDPSELSCVSEHQKTVRQRIHWNGGCITEFEEGIDLDNTKLNGGAPNASLTRRYRLTRYDCSLTFWLRSCRNLTRVPREESRRYRGVGGCGVSPLQSRRAAGPGEGVVGFRR
jgi:hypothetical protein